MLLNDLYGTDTLHIDSTVSLKKYPLGLNGGSDESSNIVGFAHSLAPFGLPSDIQPPQQMPFVPPTPYGITRWLGRVMSFVGEVYHKCVYR